MTNTKFPIWKITDHEWDQLTLVVNFLFGLRVNEIPNKTNESNLLLVWITVCIESCLPIGCRTFIWRKNPPKCCSILVWIAGCWNSLLANRNPKNIWCLSRIFGAGFGGKPIAVHVLIKACPVQCYHSHADPIWPDGTYNSFRTWGLQPTGKVSPTTAH